MPSLRVRFSCFCFSRFQGGWAARSLQATLLPLGSHTASQPRPSEGPAAPPAPQARVKAEGGRSAAPFAPRAGGGSAQGPPAGGREEGGQAQGWEPCIPAPPAPLPASLSQKDGLVTWSPACLLCVKNSHPQRACPPPPRGELPLWVGAWPGRCALRAPGWRSPCLGP